MVWDLAWWGNSSDGNKVGVALPSPLAPLRNTSSDNGVLKGHHINTVVGSVVCHRQHPAIPQLEVDPSQGKDERNGLTTTAGHSVCNGTKTQRPSYD